MKKQLQVVIVVHHLGYREFRGPAIAGAVLTCGILSLAYLLTMSPLAAVGGHIIAHSGAILLGRELPPPQEKRGLLAIGSLSLQFISSPQEFQLGRWSARGSSL